MITVIIYENGQQIKLPADEVKIYDPFPNVPAQKEGLDKAPKIGA